MVKPPWWIIFICLMTVDLPDSPGPLMRIFIAPIFSRLDTDSANDAEEPPAAAAAPRP